MAKIYSNNKQFNGIGLKKEDLIKALILWDKEHKAEAEEIETVSEMEE